MVFIKAVFTLTSSEAKKLISEAVCKIPEVKKALEKEKLIIGGGTTNAFIAEKMTGRKIDKAAYSAGIITEGRQCITPGSERIQPIAFENGKESGRTWTEIIEDFTAADVFIKGGNAVDYSGNVGVLVANPFGGTIAKALSIAAARGSHLILPIGLEKMVPDVIKAAEKSGIMRFNYSIGKKVGMMPVSYGKVITEIEALEILGGVEAVCIGAGGVGGSEGSVVISIEGNKEDTEKTMNIINEIKGEPGVRSLKGNCYYCEDKCNGPTDEVR